MQVVLLQDVKGQGKAGELKKVSEGYARNFLFPRQLAKEATPDVLRDIDQKRQAEAKKEQKQVMDAKELASKLSAYTLQLTVKVGEGGKAFGAITSKQIADALHEAGFDVDKKKIVLHDGIRGLGTFDVPVKVYHDVTANLTVHVAAE